MFMVINNSYYLDKIEINHDLEKETGLVFNNLFCDISSGNIIISGNLTSNNQGSAVVIGAYTFKSDEVLEIAANAFVIDKINNSFNLKFNKKDFDKIFLYANHINRKKNTDISNFQVSDDSVAFDVKIEHSVNDKFVDDTPTNQFNLVDKLLNSYSIADDMYTSYGIKVLGVGIDDESLDLDELSVNIELFFEKKIESDLLLYVVFYDKNNNILANDYNYLSKESNKKRCMETIDFYDVKFAKAEKFKIFVTEN